MHLLPKVFRTEGDMVAFDPIKIQESIIRETEMSEKDAKQVTELVVRRIISSGMKFLSGPHIREIVCSILSEQDFERERKLYTRIGMPLMDYEEILERGPKGYDKTKLINPEKIHHWAANQISKEYAHLRILTGEQSEAHLYGDLYIHNLKYFDLRPASQVWDPRLILKYGLPPVNDWSHCCKSGPAGLLRVAVNHLAKFLGVTQGEFCGSQGYNFINTFLAPYAHGLSEEDIEQSIQSLIYELNQLSAVIGRDIPNTQLSFSPRIPEWMESLPAIGAYGQQKGVYGDYQAECLKLFHAAVKIYTQGDYQAHPFVYPKHLIYWKKDWQDNVEGAYGTVCEEIKTARSGVLINLDCPWLSEKIRQEYEREDFVNFGTLQTVSLNLPRYSYQVTNEDAFFEQVYDFCKMAAEILVKKRELVEKQLNTSHLPLCGGIIEQNTLLNMQKQDLAISFIGLNEAVRNLTNSPLHESPESLEMGLTIVKEMQKFCEELSILYGNAITLHENPSQKVIRRFTRLDQQHFPDSLLSLTKTDQTSYTNSYHLQSSVSMNLLEKIKTQSRFHPIVRNGSTEVLSLEEIYAENFTIESLISDAFNNSELSSLKFQGS